MAASALPADRPLSDFILRSWSVDDGLPHSTVRAIAQTPDGYIWFGTPEGVARFDGAHFDVYESALFAPLRGVGIAALYAARDGWLWIGTRGHGLWKYRDGRLLQVAAASIPATGTAIVEDAAGALWVSLDTDGLARVTGETVRKFTQADGLPSNTVRALDVRPGGEVWVGTNRGAVVIRGEVLAPKSLGPFERSAVTAMAVEPGGRSWIATSGDGLGLLEGVEVSRVNAREAAPGTSLTGLVLDRDGVLWVGTTDGLMRRHKGRFELFTTAEGLSSNTVRALFEDSEGGVWVGTDRGVNRFRGGTIRSIGSRQGLTEEFVRAVLEDRKRKVWVATSNGLFSIVGDASRRYGREQGLINNAVLSLATGADGTLWAGTYGGGLHRLAGNRFEALAGPVRQVAAPVRAIIPTQSGELWVGTSAGLLQVRASDGGAIRQLDMKNGLPSEQVNALHLDASNRLWIGTRAGLVMREPDGTIRQVAEFGQTSNVLTLSPGDGDRLWVSTARGVGVVDLKRAAAPVGVRMALPDQSYFSVVEDGRGYVWICGNRGLVKAPLSLLLQAAGGAAVNAIGVVYGRSDGMPTAQCNGATQPSGWRSAEGNLLFATAQGLADVNPAARSHDDGTPPAVQIKDIYVDGAPVTVERGGTLSLSPGTHRLEIGFIGISLSSPERLRYEFRMAGQDENWVDVQTDTKAVFTNLPSGFFRFEVRSRFAAGPPGNRITHLDVRQEPRLIETWWFRIALAMLLIGLIVAVITYRVRNLEHQRATLRETVEARTAELETEKRKLESLNEDRARLLVQVADSARAYEKLSKEDALTGIANRRELDRILVSEFARAVRNQRPLSVTLCDIDNFKRINDQHSHAVGDEVLRHVAGQLKAACRRLDSVGRYGGEEFLIILPETDHAEAMHICERLRQLIGRELAQHPTGGGKELPQVTMSFGVATLGDDATHERLLARADARLYEAKHNGRNLVRG